MEKQDSRVLIHWEGNSGDKLIEHQTRATGWYYQVVGSCSTN
ncbi:amidase [Streptococcus agalactiae]|nr:amidase [Streptococcus agalactiae]KAF1108213.1 amidase [Streptococcus agalactiae]KAF1138947.1 amidase [Streptococcus agalactiae]KAF1144394.1 amidase [Streptococcus agalactiae]KAF1145398.1 amidase [Streptococcus agalactiae]